MRTSEVYFFLSHLLSLVIWIHLSWVLIQSPIYKQVVKTPNVKTGKVLSFFFFFNQCTNSFILKMTLFPFKVHPFSIIIFVIEYSLPVHHQPTSWLGCSFHVYVTWLKIIVMAQWTTPLWRSFFSSLHLCLLVWVSVSSMSVTLCFLVAQETVCALR